MGRSDERVHAAPAYAATAAGGGRLGCSVAGLSYTGVFSVFFSGIGMLSFIYLFGYYSFIIVIFFVSIPLLFFSCIGDNEWIFFPRIFSLGSASLAHEKI